MSDEAKGKKEEKRRERRRTKGRKKEGKERERVEGEEKATRARRARLSRSYDTAIPWRENFISRHRFVTACTKLSVIYEPVQLPGTRPSTLKIHSNAKIDGRAVAVIIIINHRGQRM